MTLDVKWKQILVVIINHNSIHLERARQGKMNEHQFIFQQDKTPSNFTSNRKAHNVSYNKGSVILEIAGHGKTTFVDKNNNYRSILLSFHGTVFINKRQRTIVKLRHTLKLVQK